jgi:hypothetical protein
MRRAARILCARSRRATSRPPVTPGEE